MNYFCVKDIQRISIQTQPSGIQWKLDKALPSFSHPVPTLERSKRKEKINPGETWVPQTEMLQGQTAAPATCHDFLQTWMSLTLSPRRLRAGPVEHTGTFLCTKKVRYTLTSADNMDLRPNAPRGAARSKIGAQDDKTRKHLPERTAQHPNAAPK